MGTQTKRQSDDEFGGIGMISDFIFLKTASVCAGYIAWNLLPT